MIPAVRLAIAALVVFSGACSRGASDDGFARGSGLETTHLPVAAKVAIYDVALRAAFDVGPGLTLLLDPRFLPRTAGLGIGPPVPKELVDALQRRGVVHGICQPSAAESREAARCEVANPGYIVRFSEVFRIRGDSVQLHVAVERYNTETSAASEVLRFEKAYQVVGSGTTWRVARQGRISYAPRGKRPSLPA